MATEIIMPKAGMDMEEGTIIKWLKREGQPVEVGEPILEILTDKVNMEVEAEVSGTLIKIIGKENEILPVYTVIGYISKEGEEAVEVNKQREVSKVDTEINEVHDEEVYDVVVLGGGPGGYVAAIRAAQLGGRVALIEKDALGGTCLNAGCIPTKVLVNNAKLLQSIKGAEKRGILVEPPKIDMPKMTENKNLIVKKLAAGVGAILKSYNIKVYSGKGHVNGNKTIDVVEGRDKGIVISFKKLIIATGATTIIPSIAGIKDSNVLNSTDILDMQEIPKELIVIGGGVIGCEIAAIFNSFGSNVTIIQTPPRLIPNMDKDISATLTNIFIKSGIKILLNTNVERIEKDINKYKVTVFNDERIQISGDKVMISIGRKANLDDLKDSGIYMEQQTIKVDEYMQTSIENIYAIGDVTRKNQLAHVASAQGIKAAENAMGHNTKMKYNVVPNCLFTIPEIGVVGLTEEEAKNKFGDIHIGKFPMSASGKALTMGETEGFTKIIADKKYGEILGVHVIGPNATEIIAEATAIMKLEGTVDDLVDIIHAHPTISETIMEAAHDILGGAIHLPRRGTNP